MVLDRDELPVAKLCRSDQCVDRRARPSTATARLEALLQLVAEAQLGGSIWPAPILCGGSVRSVPAVVCATHLGRGEKQAREKNKTKKPHKKKRLAIDSEDEGICQIEPDGRADAAAGAGLVPQLSWPSATLFASSSQCRCTARQRPAVPPSPTREASGL
eukprot:SAG31_NODE_797_length_12029_cov_13.875692_5_plen_160_part_00